MNILRRRRKRGLRSNPNNDIEGLTINEGKIVTFRGTVRAKDKEEAKDKIERGIQAMGYDLFHIKGPVVEYSSPVEEIEDWKEAEVDLHFDWMAYISYL